MADNDVYSFYKNRKITLDDDFKMPNDIMRHLKYLRKWAAGFKQFFPKPHENLGYWNYKIPVRDCFVEGKYSANNIKRFCLEMLLESLHHLIHNNHRYQYNYCKITVLISSPNFHASEIIIFYDEETFIRFTNRNSIYQKWIVIPGSNNDMLHELNISISPLLKYTRYNEIIIDEDFSGGKYEGEIYLIESK